MTTKTRKKRKTQSGKSNKTRQFASFKVRNRLEEKIQQVLNHVLQGRFGYETERLTYNIPASTHTYTPDFVIGNNTYIETKGIWDSADRKKMLLVKEQHPDKRFIMCFYNSNYRIYKGSKTTYSAWCDSHGLEWCTPQQLESGEFKL